MSKFANSKILEASGICCDMASYGLYWVHNDSGNTSILYLTTEDGVDVASYLLPIRAIDTEDCACEMVNGIKTLILADVGDNACNRSSYKIFVINLDTIQDAVKDISVIEFTYPDGKKRNCEACSILPNGKITLVTKCYPAISGKTQVFTIDSYLTGLKIPALTPGPVLNANLGIIMGMDYSSQRKEYVLLGNGRLHFFAEGNWLKEIRTIKHPVINQPEGCCYSHDLKRVVVVGESLKGSGLTSDIVTCAI